MLSHSGIAGPLGLQSGLPPSSRGGVSRPKVSPMIMAVRERITKRASMMKIARAESLERK